MKTGVGDVESSYPCSEYHNRFRSAPDKGHNSATPLSPTISDPPNFQRSKRIVGTKSFLGFSGSTNLYLKSLPEIPTSLASANLCASSM